RCTKHFPATYSVDFLRLTRCKCKNHYNQDKPEQREYQPVSEEVSKVHSGHAGDYHIPERRYQISHVIANTQRQKPTLYGHAGGHCGSGGYVSLNHPLPTARRNEYRHYSTRDGCDKWK